MEVEIWKEIENHPNYLISNFGRIKSNKITINKENKYYQTRLVRDCYGYYFLKPHKESNGYLVVFIDGKFYKMHRLVATALSFFTEMAGAKFFGVSVKAINNCLKGRSKTCAGMLWSYDD